MTQDRSLSDILSSAQASHAGLTYQTAPNWTQGRTAFGGFTSALLVHTALEQHADLPPLRSAMINFTAPVSEAATVSTELLRQGRNITTLAARAESAGKTAATASLSFGAAQPSRITHDLPAAPAPDPDARGIIPSDGAGPVPGFFKSFDLIPVEFALPFSGADTTSLRMWVRHKDTAMRTGLAGLLSVADFLPPVVLPRLNVLAMNSSVNWMVNILPDAPETEDGWWLLESRLSAAHNGFSSQVMRVWNTKRQLVIDGMQSVVVFEQS